MITRRRWERVRVKVAVVIVDAAGRRIAEASTTDACEAGLGLQSPVGLEPGNIYGFIIAGIAPEAFKGIVRWSTPDATGTQVTIGVELTGETRAQGDALRAAVARWRQAVSKGLSP